MVSVKDLQDVVDDLRGQAGKRASELLGDGKTEVRRAVGGHSDGTLIGVLWLGIVLGAVVGAALALLFAPFSGDEARKRIGKSVDKVRMGEPAMTNGNGSTRASSSAGSPPYVSS
jgi:uncharacterized membrane protein